MTPPITTFNGPHRFLSNFYAARVVLDGHSYPTVEHAFQAAKTTDVKLRLPLHALQPLTAAQAKAFGRRLPLRPDWEAVKRTVMHDLLIQKFDPTNGTDNCARLLATKPAELIEGNWWGDTYWGVCNGVGENWLGKLLMEIRDAD